MLNVPLGYQRIKKYMGYAKGFEFLCANLTHYVQLNSAGIRY